MNRRCGDKLKTAKPGPALSLEALQMTACRPGGRTLLQEEKKRLVAQREMLSRHYQDQMAELDELIQRFDLAINGGIKA